jgi:hypothetical protein
VTEGRWLVDTAVRTLALQGWAAVPRHDEICPQFDAGKQTESHTKVYGAALL